MPTVCSTCQLELHDEEPAHIDDGRVICHWCHWRSRPICPYCQGPLSKFPISWTKCKACGQRVVHNPDQYFFTTPLITVLQSRELADCLRDDLDFGPCLRVASARARRKKLDLHGLRNECEIRLSELLCAEAGVSKEDSVAMGHKACLAAARAQLLLNRCLHNEQTLRRCIRTMLSLGPAYWRAASAGDVIWSILEEDYLAAVSSQRLDTASRILWEKARWLFIEGRDPSELLKRSFVDEARAMNSSPNSLFVVSSGCSASEGLEKKHYSITQLIENCPIDLPLKI